MLRSPKKTPNRKRVPPNSQFPSLNTQKGFTITAPRSFYTGVLSASTAKVLRAAPRDQQLGEEIALVRLQIRELLARTHTDDGSTASLDQSLFIRLVDVLARLVRLQSNLQPDQEDLLGDLNEQVLRRLEAVDAPA